MGGVGGGGSSVFVADSIRDYRFTAVPSAACLIPLYTFQPFFFMKTGIAKKNENTQKYAFNNGDEKKKEEKSEIRSDKTNYN